jgi:uncharacterized protein GlcG (DUF336 family)
LTGDVGRGCGDASRALLFLQFQLRPPLHARRESAGMTLPPLPAGFNPMAWYKRPWYNQKPCERRWVVCVAQQRQFGDMAMRTKFSLSFEDAQTIAAACLEAAQQHDVQVSVAVVDDAGVLLHFSHMDGARAYTVELASQKARTSANVGVPTGVIEAMYRERPGQSRESNVGRGGVPVQYKGQCAGAVGVSGAKPEVDEIIAQAGVAVLTA